MYIIESLVRLYIGIQLFSPCYDAATSIDTFYSRDNSTLAWSDYVWQILGIKLLNFVLIFIRVQRFFSLNFSTMIGMKKVTRGTFCRARQDASAHVDPNKLICIISRVRTVFVWSSRATGGYICVVAGIKIFCISTPPPST